MQEEKMVDIDTSGPGAEIELEDNSKENENVVETQNEKTGWFDRRNGLFTRFRRCSGERIYRG